MDKPYAINTVADKKASFCSIKYLNATQLFPFGSILLNPFATRKAVTKLLFYVSSLSVVCMINRLFENAVVSSEDWPFREK